MSPVIGVLALQGDVRQHREMLEASGARTLAVRRPSELDEVDGIVLPGGESTTMAKLAQTFGVLDPLRDRIRGGLPAFGTCAGMILLADRIEGGIAGQETIGGLDVVVRRNAFGRQVDSFEADLDVEGFAEPFHAGRDADRVADSPCVNFASRAVGIELEYPRPVSFGRIVGIVRSGTDRDVHLFAIGREREAASPMPATAQQTARRKFGAQLFRRAARPQVAVAIGVTNHTVRVGDVEKLWVRPRRIKGDPEWLDSGCRRRGRFDSSRACRRHSCPAAREFDCAGFRSRKGRRSARCAETADRETRGRIPRS